MPQNAAHAPTPHACQPGDQAQCSTCSLAYNCRRTNDTSAFSAPVVTLAALLAIGGALRLFGIV